MSKDHITAVDIGTNSVKVLQLDLTQTGLTVINSGIGNYPRRSASEQISDEVIADTLGQLLRDRVIRTKPVAMAFPRQDVTVKSLTGLPSSATDEDIDNMVPIQVDSELPFAIEDAIYSAYNFQRAPESISLQVVAAKKSSVRRYVNIADQIGLKLTSIVPSAFATYALIFDRYKDQLAGRTFAVVDVGAGMADICIIQHGRLASSRSFSSGGNSLTQAFEMQHKLSFQEAEERKILEANLRSEETDTPTHRWANGLAAQIEQSLRAFKASSGTNGTSTANNIDGLWLCGGSSLVSGLDDYLARRLNIETDLWNPIQGLPGQLPESDGQAGFSVALGVGIIGAAGEDRAATVNANLLPADIRERAERAKKKIMAFAAIAVAVVIIAGAGLGFITWRQSKESRYRDVVNSLTTLNQKEETSKAKIALENSILIQQATVPYVTPLEILREMSSKLPNRRQIALSNLNIDKKGKVTMGVEANSHADVSQMIVALSELQLLDKVKLFDEVKHGAISKVTKDKRPVLQVQIACSLNEDAMQEMK